MKNIILGLIGSLLVLYTILLSLGMYSLSARRNELSNSLAEVMESIMERYYMTEERKEFLPVDTEIETEVCNLIQEELSLRLSADSDVEIRISACDMEKGLLAVCAKESFRMPNGRVRNISCEKTLIADSDVTHSGMLTVRYLCDENVYKEYGVSYGQKLFQPKSPEGEGRFLGWHLQGTNDHDLYDFSGEERVVADMTFVAVFER